MQLSSQLYLPNALYRNKSVILLVLAYSLSQGIQEAILPVLNLDIGPVGIPEVSAAAAAAFS